MSEALSIEEVFDLCCEAFEMGLVAFANDNEPAHQAAREIHSAYVELYAHLSDGGMIH